VNVDRKATKLALSDLKGTSGELVGTLSAAEFIRIPTEIALVKDVNYRFNYQLVEDKIKIQLECVGKFKTECQRCLEKFTFSEKVEVSDSLPFDKLKKTADEGFLLYENGEVDLVKTLEDEFLLCLPMVPKHDIDDCDLKVIEAVDSELERKKTPFSILKDLL
tara:strand:- start:1379 stop:1867 length:489 start_codon:yes stop_codon:yes gene_type:complete